MTIINSLDKATQEWSGQAALGKCSWICSDCGAHFSDGMPDECAYGHQRCTDIIQRDKKAAMKEG